MAPHLNLSAHNTYGKRKLLKMKYIRTPPQIWESLNNEFKFTIDACASDKNHLVPRYWTKEKNALKQDWTGEIVYCHPMFDNYIPQFVKKAVLSKCKTVFLLPASTNSLYFHTHMWDATLHRPRSNVQVRFIGPAESKHKGYLFATEEGVLPDRGYLRPLMVVIVDNLKKNA